MAAFCCDAKRSIVDLQSAWVAKADTHPNVRMDHEIASGQSRIAGIE